MYKKFNSKEEVVEFLSKVSSLEYIDGKFYNKHRELKPWERKPVEYAPTKRDKNWYISRKVYTDIGDRSVRLTEEEVDMLFVKAKGLNWGNPN
jgi:hypothetical protein